MKQKIFKMKTSDLSINLLAKHLNIPKLNLIKSKCCIQKDNIKQLGIHVECLTIHQQLRKCHVNHID